MKTLTLIKQSFSTRHLKKVSLRKCYFCVYGMGTLLDQKHFFYYQAKNCINASLYEKMQQAKGGFIFMRPFSFRIVFTSKGVRVGVVIRRVELYDLVKTAF